MTRVRPLTIFFISAGTLAFEILLVRVFAIEHFHHFAYMAIGVAMLGFGVSGTTIALIGHVGRPTAARCFVWAAIATPVSLVMSPALVHLVSLDTTQLAWNAGQWVRMAVVYALLALPFAIGALTVLFGLTLKHDEPGGVYGASFLGSGFGAALSLVSLWLVDPGRALAWPALVAAAGAVAAAWDSSRRRSLIAAWTTVGASLVVAIHPLWQLRISPYKQLPQVEAYPDAQRTADQVHPVGWAVAVEAPAFHYVPGLSLRYQGQLPSQRALFIDGQLVGAATDWDSSSIAVLDWLPTSAALAVSRPRHVLVVAAGGDTETTNASFHGAAAVTAIELHPYIVDLARAPAEPIRDAMGSLRWVVGDGRSYVAKTDERFDLISLAPTGGFGTSAGGVHSLNESFLHTVEAYAAYLQSLSDSGMLAITSWLSVPPRSNVRVILTAAEALRRVAPDAPPSGLAVTHSWGTATILVKPSGFTPGDITALQAWTEARLFDLDWYPGLTSAPTNQFNVLEQPVLYQAAAAAVSNLRTRESFVRDYAFDVAPSTDAKPYPQHFMRLGSLARLLSSDRGSWLPFAEWGQVAVVATLVQSVALAILFMILPVAVRGVPRPAADWSTMVTYFTAIGIAYLTAEIAAIQQLSLLLGHPIYAVALSLAAFLICSGFGSTWSDRIGPARSAIVAGSLAVLLVVYSVMLLDLVHVLQPTPLVTRGIAATLALAIPAFFMGVPFPTGLRLFVGSDVGHTAWAWAANGFASVVAAPLAALLALEAGSPTLFLVAAAAYGLATVMAFTRGRTQIDRSGS